MPREFSISVGINATRAKTGAATFKRSADTINRSNRKITRGMVKSKKATLAFITTLGRLRGVATIAFAGFLGVGGIGAVIRTLSQFGTAMSAVHAILGPRGTQGVMAALTDKARELGATTLFTATQAAEGMKFLALAGFETLEVYQAIEPALNLAAAGMLGLGEAADIVSNVMSAFNIEASKTTSVTDALAFTASRTNTDIRQLGQAMKFVGPVAGTLGINVEETAVALGILGNAGLQASLAGTSLRRVMSGLLNPSKEASKVLADMGLTSGELAEIMQGPKGIVNLVKLLAERGIDAASAFTLFGQRGAPGLLALVTQVDDLEKLTEGLDEAAGTAKRMADILADNLGGDARIALSALQESILRIGDAGLNDWLRDSVQGFIGFIRALSNIPQKLDEMSESMVKGAAIGKKLRDNFGLIKKILTVLVTVMFRKVIFSLALISKALIVGAFSAIKLAFSFQTVGQAMLFATVGARTLMTALIPFAPLLLALGVAAAFLFKDAFVSGAENTDRLATDIEELFIEAEKLAFVFDLVGRKQQEWAAIKLAESVRADRLEVLALELQIRSLATTEAMLAQAQLDLARAIDDLDNSGGGAAMEEARQAVFGYTSEIERLKLIVSTSNIPELEAEIERLNERIAAGEVNLEGMKAVLEGSVASLKAYKEGLEEGTDAMQDFIDKFKALTGLSAQQAEGFKKIQDEANPSAVAIAKVQAQIELFNEALKNKDKLIEAGLATAEDFIRIQKLLDFLMEEATGILNKQEKAAEATADAWKGIEERLDPVLALQRKFEEESVIVTEALLAEGASIAEVAAEIAKLRAELDKNIAKIDEQCEANKKLRECMSDSAKRMEKIWEQSMRNIQDAFADAFRGVFDDFESFADKLLDAFKDLFANIAAEKFLGGLFDNINISGGGTGGNSFLDSIMGMFGGGGGAPEGALTGVDVFDMGRGGVQGAQTVFADGSGGGFLGGLSSMFGGGAEGGGFLSSLFGGGATTGGTSSLGSMGASGGPVAALIVAAAITNLNLFDAGYKAATDDINASKLFRESLIAGFFSPGTSILGLTVAIPLVLDSMFQKLGLDSKTASFLSGSSGIVALFGRKAPKAVRSGVDVGLNAGQIVGEQFVDWIAKGGIFRSDKRGTEISPLDAEFAAGLQEGFDALLAPFVQIAELLGGDISGLTEFTSGTTRLQLKGLDDDEIAILIEEFLNDAVMSAVVLFIQGTDSLAAHLKQTALAFGNDAQELFTAFQLVTSISVSSKFDPLVEGALAFADAQKTTSERLADNVVLLNEAVLAYDGSLESLEVLANAYSVVTSGQAELAAMLMALDDQVSTLFQGSAQSIREALLNDEELFNLRKTQIDELVALAAETSDPETLARLAEEINSLGLDAFNLLDEDQQALLGPEFIEFFEGLDALFGDQIAEGLANIAEENSAINTEVADKMIEAAEAQIAAADAARDLYEVWREDIISGGGNLIALDERELAA